MPAAEIITIGTEILLGEILDTNAKWIALRLRETGIDIYRKSTVGDNVDRISAAIQEAIQRCDIVITTGGLGPTVDDPTRLAVAKAVSVDVEFRPELWEQIQSRFQRYNRQPSENNRRQAYIPLGAIAIENPVGTAPAFMYEIANRVILSLPGVPSEMKYLLDHAVLPYLRQKYQIHSIIHTRILHTAGIGESMIDDQIGDLEMLSNPTVGLAAHSGQVDIRLVVKAESMEKAVELITPIELDLRKRLGEWIYGADEESLESVALANLAKTMWRLVVAEAGLNGELSRRLAQLNSPLFKSGLVLNDRPSKDELLNSINYLRDTYQAEVGLGVAIYPSGERQDVHFILHSPTGISEFDRPYGGPPDYAPRWATHHGLDLIRRVGKE